MNWSDSRGMRKGTERTERERQHRLAIIAARKSAGMPLNEAGPGSSERPEPTRPRLKWQDKECPGWEGPVVEGSDG